MPETILNGVRFAYAGAVTCDRDTSGRVLVDTPSRTYANPKNLPLGEYGRGPFARLSLVTTEPRPGVFAIAIDDRIAYVAKTVASLSASFGPLGFGTIESRACFGDRDAVRCRINAETTQALLRDALVTVFFHATPHAADLERSLVATLAPRWNAVRAGELSPTAMRPSTAAAIRDLSAAGVGVPEIAARLGVRESFAFRIVAKMERHHSRIADAG